MDLGRKTKRIEQEIDFFFKCKSVLRNFLSQDKSYSNYNFNHDP